MIAVKLAKRHVVTIRNQTLRKPAPATFDRQNVIVCAVGNEDAGLAVRRAVDQKPRRKRRYAAKQIAIHQAQRQPIRRAVRETTDRHSCRIDRDEFKCAFERAIHVSEVFAEVAANRVPRRVTRLRGEHNHTCFVRRVAEIPKHPVGVLRRTVQHQQERQGRLGRVFWYLKNRFVIGAEIEVELTANSRLHVAAGARTESSAANRTGKGTTARTRCCERRKRSTSNAAEVTPRYLPHALAKILLFHARDIRTISVRSNSKRFS